MRSGLLRSPSPSSLPTLICSLLLLSLVHSNPTPPHLQDRDTDQPPLPPRDIDWDAAASSSLRDNKYLPAQIGGIVGAYAVSLVLVAIGLLSLAKKRREHLNAGEEELDFELDLTQDLYSPDFPPAEFGSTEVPNFSYPSPIKTEFSAAPAPYIQPSPVSSVTAPGVDALVDQRVVLADRAMAQDQLEEMYKLVMEQDEAKQKGIVLDTPAPLPSMAPMSQRASTSDKSSIKTTFSKKSKPASLNLAGATAAEEKTQSRTSSLFSALRSPRKKTVKGVNISSPIMTPQSGTFPRNEPHELAAIPPRHYNPGPPPPVPTGQGPLHIGGRTNGAPLTPDMSPQSVQSIDERLQTQFGSDSLSQAPTERDPESATSEHSQSGLVHYAAATTPRASRSQLPSLPSSPKPGATFQRANVPSAVRTGGNLPLRAYEPALASPSTIARTTKQTVFERRGPLSPTTGRTPMTANAVPYSPYQPFTPCVPVTPSLVTKEDRKRMKRMVPKTPTLQMVQSSDDIW